MNDSFFLLKKRDHSFVASNFMDSNHGDMFVFRWLVNWDFTGVLWNNSAPLQVLEKAVGKVLTWTKKIKKIIEDITECTSNKKQGETSLVFVLPLTWNTWNILLSTLDHLPKFQGKKASQKSLKPPNRILRTTTIPPPPPLLFCCNSTLNKKVTNTTFSWGNEKRLPSGKLTQAHENPPFPIGNTSTNGGISSQLC